MIVLLGAWQTLEKTGGDAEYIQKAKQNVEHWKGLCLRGFDYSQIALFQIDQLQLGVDETEEDDQETMEEMAEMRLK